MIWSSPCSPGHTRWHYRCPRPHPSPCNATRTWEKEFPWFLFIIYLIRIAADELCVMRIATLFMRILNPIARGVNIDKSFKTWRHLAQQKQPFVPPTRQDWPWKKHFMNLSMQKLEKRKVSHTIWLIILQIKIFDRLFRTFGCLTLLAQLDYIHSVDNLTIYIWRWREFFATLVALHSHNSHSK